MPVGGRGTPHDFALMALRRHGRLSCHPGRAARRQATTCHPERSLRKQVTTCHPERSEPKASEVEGSPARRMPGRARSRGTVLRLVASWGPHVHGRGTVFGLVASRGTSRPWFRNGISTRGIREANRGPPAMPRVGIPFLLAEPRASGHATSRNTGPEDPYPTIRPCHESKYRSSTVRASCHPVCGDPSTSPAFGSLRSG